MTLWDRIVNYLEHNQKSPIQGLYRRVRAVEEHLRSLETRYSDLEGRLNSHSQGVTHRKPKDKEPEPDVE